MLYSAAVAAATAATAAATTAMFTIANSVKRRFSKKTNMGLLDACVSSEAV